MLSEVLGHQSAVLCCPHSEDCCIAHKPPQAKALDRKVTLGLEAHLLLHRDIKLASTAVRRYSSNLWTAGKYIRPQETLSAFSHTCEL